MRPEAVPQPMGAWAELVASKIGASREELRFQPCSTGKFNTTHFVEVPASHSPGHELGLVLRVAPPDDRSRMLFYEHRMMRQEPFLHFHLRSRTEVPVPAILAHGTHCARDYVLMERLPGVPLSDYPGLSRKVFDGLLAEIGWCLRQVHNLRGVCYGYVHTEAVDKLGLSEGNTLSRKRDGLRDTFAADDYSPMPPQVDWASAFVLMWNSLLDDIEGCGGYDSTEADHMRRLLDKHIKVFDQEVAASLLHMDVWSQNILADHNGKLTGLVDWDRALWGDPGIEFAVLDYCGISEPSFWEGYGGRREGSPEAEVRRLFYVLYELQKYIFIRRVRGHDPQAADRYRRQSLELARSLPRVLA